MNKIAKVTIIFIGVVAAPVLAWAAFQWNGASITAWNGASITAWNGASVGESNVAQYFGSVTSSGDPFSTPEGQTEGFSGVVWNSGTTFTCPGTGTRTIDSLGIYMRSNTGQTAYVQLGFYTTDGTRLFYGSSQASTSSTSDTWVEQSSFTGTAQCTGGTNYIILADFDSGGTNIGVDYRNTGYVIDNFKYDSGTWPPPASLPTGSNLGGFVFLRAHVTAGS